MKIGIIKAPLAAAAMLLVMSATAQAQDTFLVDCASLEGLNTTMGYLTFASDATTSKDRDGLEGKLDDAQAKLDEGKLCNAGLKISDFYSKVFSLDNATKAKIGETAPGAIDCALTGSQALSQDWLTGCEDPGDPPRGNGGGKGPKNK
jgi:hypothetical protein